MISKAKPGISYLQPSFVPNLSTFLCCLLEACQVFFFADQAFPLHHFSQLAIVTDIICHGCYRRDAAGSGKVLGRCQCFRDWSHWLCGPCAGRKTASYSPRHRENLCAYSTQARQKHGGSPQGDQGQLSKFKTKIQD